ncbi:hypothetical protein M5D96_003936, partial [Drosophila gunungcola]
KLHSIAVFQLPLRWPFVGCRLPRLFLFFLDFLSWPCVRDSNNNYRRTPLTLQSPSPFFYKFSCRSKLQINLGAPILFLP